MKRGKLTAVVAFTVSAMLALSGCGGSDTATDAVDNGEEITLDVYDDFANYAGEQKGWFAQVIKDKFNIKLNIIAPNVSGGGSTLFDTRSAAGDLGDIVLYNANNHSTADLIKAGLIADMTPYLDDAEYIKQYSSATDSINEVAGQESGVWGIPGSVSAQSPETSSEGNEPTFGPYIRWDYYAEIGYPEIKDMDDLLDVLEQMQEQARADTGSTDVYALSLFKDWDDNMMNNAKQPTCFYGFDEMGFVLAKADGSDYEDVSEEGGIYEQTLEFFNQAYQRGLVDPESSTQSYDTMYAKYQEGNVLFSFWPWLGQAAYNTTENKAAGKGFMLAPLEDMQIFSYGATPNGGTYVIALGAKAEYKQRCVDFINWLYSPEGIYASGGQTSGSSAGVEGLTWELNDDGEPVLTDFGYQVKYGSGGTVPDEYGGGNYTDGVSALNFVTVLASDIDPETGYAYDASLWPSVIESQFSTALDNDWSEHMGGAKTAMEYLEANDKILVAPGASFVKPEDDSQISTLRGQLKTTVVNASWQAVFASSDSEFQSILDGMRTDLEGLGYDQVLEVDMKNAQDQDAARKQIVEDYQSEN
ncbi:ABC transporter substrate-binding protein [Bifidobacterium eulemuris]|uniref:ABC transporter substrate-binding protein n=1 Tax=Bifidobacterium eulemuris TaxID=1765219 RepID=A0A261GDD7_9BIFI|nr:extracellular solute-binding protein [Bifidobacterium eulemuris]OZG69452.1 ABC transporter substrate-binding protein [Bifidobacterium eulemuris]QOL32185.1 extracellular solute-binding protein [Bifidobacterium eulemuris]